MIRRLALALLLAVPGSAFSRAPLSVVTTSADLKALVQAVGGARVQAESLAAPGQDPHTFEIKPAQLARLRAAALLVRVGLDHEPWLKALTLASPVLDASKGVRLLQAETPRLRATRHAHVHAYGNTHYWLDPRNAAPITASIAEALSGIDPDGRGAFESNRATFLRELEVKIPQWEKRLAPLKGARVVVVHDSWSYFAERFGLRIVAAAEPNPGVPPSPAELAQLFRRMREAGVRVLIADPHSNPSLVQQIAERTGATPVTLLPSGNDYLALLEENVRRLAQAPN